MQSNLQVYHHLQEQEDARALQASRATYTERFHMLMRLIRVSAMISNAKIVSSPIIISEKIK